MSIHLIMGAMGAGKTATLLKDYNKVPENKRIMLKHQFDNRFSSDFNSLVCRDGTAVHATPVNRLDDASARIRARFGTLSLIAVDEGHFFDDITEFASMWARHGKNVIVTGIGRGLFMEPLPNMSNLLAKADSVTVLTGICKLCSGVAGFNYRVSAFCEDTEDPVLKFVGDKEYIALCRNCFYKRMREDLDEKKGMFVDEKLRNRAEHMFLAERPLVPNDQPLHSVGGLTTKIPTHIMNGLNYIFHRANNSKAAFQPHPDMVMLSSSAYHNYIRGPAWIVGHLKDDCLQQWLLTVQEVAHYSQKCIPGRRGQCDMCPTAKYELCDLSNTNLYEEWGPGAICMYDKPNSEFSKAIDDASSS